MFILIISGTYIYGDVNIALKKDIHKAGLFDPIAGITEEVINITSSDDSTRVLLYSNVLEHYMRDRPELKGRLIYLTGSKHQLPRMFNDLKPARIIYIWSYYGRLRRYKNTDALTRTFLKEKYAEISSKKLVKDSRWDRLSPMMNKKLKTNYLNEAGHRYIIKEYKRCTP